LRLHVKKLERFYLLVHKWNLAGAAV
jgi:hypothetical protein